MKIAFIVGTFPSLSETFILNQITGLLELGHDIEIFSLLRSKDTKRHDIINKLNLMDKVRYFPEIPKNSFLRLMKGKFLLVKNFWKDPGRMAGSINIFKRDKDIISLKILYHIIPFLGKDFDIIHSHFGHIGNIGVYLRKGGIKGKLVTTFYGYDITAILKQYGTGVYKNLALYGDLFLPICNYFKNILVDLKFDQNKIQIHPLGIEVDKFISKEQRIIPGEIFNILTIGRLTEKKGYFFSLSAIKKLIDRNINIKYTIIGEGPLLNEIRERIEEYGISDFIDLVGAVDQDDIKNYFNKAHIFLLPSITADNGDQEGTPTVLLEAQAFGLPVISTYHSGIPEIVLSEKTGYLVEEKNSEDIADRLIYLIEHKKELSEMGKNGRKFVEDNFNVNNLNKELEKKYLDLLKK